MVRTYIRKKNYAAVSEETIKTAVKNVLRGNMSIRTAASAFDIRKSTLHDRVSKAKKETVWDLGNDSNEDTHSGLSKHASLQGLLETKIEDDMDDSENIEIDDTYIRPEFVELKRNQNQLNIEESESNYVLRNPLQVGDKVVDEFQVFGDFVASELRSLQSRDNQNKLKRLIQRSILEISEIDDNEVKL